MKKIKSKTKDKLIQENKELQKYRALFIDKIMEYSGELGLKFDGEEINYYISKEPEELFCIAMNRLAIWELHNTFNKIKGEQNYFILLTNVERN